MRESMMPPSPRGKSPQKKSPAATRKPAVQPNRTARRAVLKRKHGIRPWWYGFLISMGIMTVLAACGVGIFLAIIYTLSPPDPLEYYSPEEVTRVYDRTGTRLIGEFHNKDGQQRVLVSLEEIPPLLRNAFLAIEDRRFYDHFGVDIIGITRAICRRLAGGRLEGGSTLTQQLTRNVGLVSFKQTLSRKIKEAFLAVWIERHYSKDQILEFYLNQVPEGGNVYGVKMAAEKYFGKDLNELSVAECATLAGIPKDPTNLNPLVKPDRAKDRRNIVLKQMLDLGVIKQDQYETAKNEPLVIRKDKRQVAGTGSLYPYFINGLETDLLKYYRQDLEQLDQDLSTKKAGLQQQKAKGKAGSEPDREDPASRALQTTGLRITTTIDPQIQEICQKTLRTGLETLEAVWQSKKEARQTRENKKWNGQLKSGDVKLMRITRIDDETVTVNLNQYTLKIPKPEVLPFYNADKAFKVGQLLDVRVTGIDDKTGKLTGAFADERPMQGSLVVLNVHNGEVLAMAGGAGFRSEESGWLNQAMSNARQMGSCFKPFFYAAAFEYGHSPNEIIVDEPIEFTSGGRSYRPTNYEREDGMPKYFGPNTLIEALEHSRNVSTIRLFEALTISKALEVVRRFDFAYSQPQWKIDPYIPVCLGSVTSSPFVMASAYQVFANNGTGIRPQFVRSIVDSQGRIPFPIKRPEFDVIKPMSAFQMQYLMRQVVTQVEDHATGQEVGKAFPSPPYPPICGKTGTTDDCRDAWFAGFTPDLVIVSQIGFDPPRSMAPGMTGGTTAAKELWVPAFREIYKTRRNWKMDFDPPGADVEYADICAATGKLGGECGHKTFTHVPFAQGKAPKVKCNGGILVPLIAPVREYADLAPLSPVHGRAHAPYSGGGSSDEDSSPE